MLLTSPNNKSAMNEHLCLSWEQIEAMPQKSERFTRLVVKHPISNHSIIFMPEYIDCSHICEEELRRLNMNDFMVEHKDTSAGKFYVCTEKPQSNHRKLQQKYSGITLHTMTRSLISTPNLRHWLQFYSERGVNEFVFCINTASPEDYMRNERLLDISYKEYNTKIYQLPFAHRYKPNFEKCDYVGDRNIISDFLRYSPANFHNIQHIAIEITANICSYDHLLHCDTDEYIDTDFSKDRKLMEANNISTVLFENCWCTYLPLPIKDDEDWLVFKNRSRNKAPARSKYMCKVRDVEYFGIHYAKTPNGTSIISTVPLNHVWNLSERRILSGKLRESTFTDHNPKFPDSLSYSEMLTWEIDHLRLRNQF